MSLTSTPKILFRNTRYSPTKTDEKSAIFWWSLLWTQTSCLFQIFSLSLSPAYVDMKWLRSNLKSGDFFQTTPATSENINLAHEYIRQSTERIHWLQTFSNNSKKILGKERTRHLNNWKQMGYCSFCKVVYLKEKKSYKMSSKRLGKNHWEIICVSYSVNDTIFCLL